VATLVERWTPYYAASNHSTRLRDIARFMTRGACGPVAMRIRRGNEKLDLKPERINQTTLIPVLTNDRPGPTLQKLSPDVAYLKLSAVKAAEAASYVEAAAGTKGLVIDIRNYPSEFMVFALGSRLVAKPTPFARFTAGDPANPGAFHWRPPLSLQPATPRYEGKIVILVDETSQSQAEYTTMAFRSAPNAIVVGSTTAGADGNVSPVPLPGGLRAMISGIGVFYPDKKPTQRIGIIPNREVLPTIAGVRAGRDEVLEAAIREIVGKDVPAAQIEKMTKP
jgi:C-terminal processing protease CtpA/Prc